MDEPLAARRGHHHVRPVGVVGDRSECAAVEPYDAQGGRQLVVHPVDGVDGAGGTTLVEHCACRIGIVDVVDDDHCAREPIAVLRLHVLEKARGEGRAVRALPDVQDQIDGGGGHAQCRPRSA